MTIATSKPTLPGITREQACQLVVNGLNSLRDGLLRYHELGLSTTDLFEDLRKQGWDKSKRTLQRVRATLVSEGLLPESNQGQRNDLAKPGSDTLSPENPLSEVAEAVGVRKVMKNLQEERLFSVVMVEALKQREVELVQLNEELQRENKELKDRVDELRDLLKDNSITV